jgi:hypothetical protein
MSETTSRDSDQITRDADRVIEMKRVARSASIEDRVVAAAIKATNIAREKLATLKIESKEKKISQLINGLSDVGSSDKDRLRKILEALTGLKLSQDSTEFMLPPLCGVVPGDNLSGHSYELGEVMFTGSEQTFTSGDLRMGLMAQLRGGKLQRGNNLCFFLDKVRLATDAEVAGAVRRYGAEQLASIMGIVILE